MKGSRYRSPTSIERDEGINRELAIGVRSPPFHPKGLWSPAARPIRNSLVLSSWWSGDICGEERAHHTSSASKTGASIWKFGKLRPVTAEEGGLVLVLIRPRPWLGYLLGLVLVAPPALLQGCPPRSGRQPAAAILLRLRRANTPIPQGSKLRCETSTGASGWQLGRVACGGTGKKLGAGSKYPLILHFNCGICGSTTQWHDGGALALPLPSSKEKKSRKQTCWRLKLENARVLASQEILLSSGAALIYLACMACKLIE